MKNIYTINKNIYITSDEEIKERDWIIENNNLGKCTNELWVKRGASILTKKIILTTDKDLIKDGVQAIDDTYLEWFVKNPSCKEVEVKSNYRVKSGTIQEHNEGKAGYEYYEYKIIIPKEEPKQETLEEAAERYADYSNDYVPMSFGDKFNETTKRDFIAGAKWQQEIIYSKEDMKQFAFECVANFLSNDDNKVEIKLVDVIIDRVNNKFEQFKKGRKD